MATLDPNAPIMQETARLIDAPLGDPIKSWTITLGEGTKEEAITVYVANSYESDMFIHRLLEDADEREHCSAYGETCKAIPRALGNRGEAQPAVHGPLTENEAWECPECGEANDSTAILCRGCAWDSSR